MGNQRVSARVCRAIVLVAAITLAMPLMGIAAGAATRSVKLKVLEKKTSVAKESAPKKFQAVTAASLAAGDTVKTDTNGFAELNYHDGSQARVDRNTTFAITKLGADNTVETRLDQGQVWNEVEKTNGKTHYQVATPNAVAAVRGTAFAMSCLNTGCVFGVVDGTVNISDPAGTVDVAAGQQVTVDPTGTVGAPEALVVSTWIAQNQAQDRAEGRTPPVPPGGTLATPGKADGTTPEAIEKAILAANAKGTADPGSVSATATAVKCTGTPKKRLKKGAVISCATIYPGGVTNPVRTIILDNKSSFSRISSFVVFDMRKEEAYEIAHPTSTGIPIIDATCPGHILKLAVPGGTLTCHAILANGVSGTFNFVLDSRGQASATLVED